MTFGWLLLGRILYKFLPGNLEDNDNCRTFAEKGTTFILFADPIFIKLLTL